MLKEIKLAAVVAAFVVASTPKQVLASYDTAVFGAWSEYCSLLRSGRESADTALYLAVQRGLKIWPEYTRSAPGAYQASVVSMIRSRPC